MINIQRLTGHVLDLIRIDSESRQEKDLALRLRKDLEALGARVEMDDAAGKTGGNSGNLIAYMRGNKESAPPLLLSAHMDTVVPGKGVRPLLEGNIIKGSGDTVLGGDDKTGLSIIMEVLRTLKEKNLPHGDLEITFTVCEEAGLLGAKALEAGKLRSKDGLVLDSEHAGILTTKGPGAVRMEFKVRGLEAHAGIAPERGISAIKIAAVAIAKMKLGRIDKETTANIGCVQGGLATNIIPNLVTLKGEARSLFVRKLQQQTIHMRGCLEEAARRHPITLNGEKIFGKVESHIEQDYHKLDLSRKARIVRIAFEAAKKLGYPLKEGATGGGSDANILNKFGIQVANLGTGMHEIHTVKEWLSLEEVERAANLVTQISVLHALEG